MPIGTAAPSAARTRARAASSRRFSRSARTLFGGAFRRRCARGDRRHRTRAGSARSSPAERGFTFARWPATCARRGVRCGVRARLAREARMHPPEVLAEWLRRSRRSARGDRGDDPYRVTRALEIALAARARRRTRRRDAPLASTTAPARRSRIASWYLDVAPQCSRRIERASTACSPRVRRRGRTLGADAVAADAVGYREALAFSRGWSTRAELGRN